MADEAARSEVVAAPGRGRGVTPRGENEGRRRTPLFLAEATRDLGPEGPGLHPMTELAH